MSDPQSDTPRASGFVRIAEYAMLAAFLGYAANLLLGAASPQLDSFFGDGVYLGLIPASALLVLARAIAVRRERVVWICIGAGLATTAFAEIYYAAVLANQLSIPVPSVADAGWLLSYPIWCLGIALLIRSRVRGIRGFVWLDAGIVALALGALTATFIAP